MCRQWIEETNTYQLIPNQVHRGFGCKNLMRGCNNSSCLTRVKTLFFCQWLNSWVYNNFIKFISKFAFKHTLIFEKKIALLYVIFCHNAKLFLPQRTSFTGFRSHVVIVENLNCSEPISSLIFLSSALVLPRGITDPLRFFPGCTKSRKKLIGNCKFILNALFLTQKPWG